MSAPLYAGMHLPPGHTPPWTHKCPHDTPLGNPLDTPLLETPDTPLSDTMVNGQQAGGTHPTGMHTCWSFCLHRQYSNQTTDILPLFSMQKIRTFREHIQFLDQI